jgi:hypothetical protein
LLRLVHTESRGKLGDDKVRALRTAAEAALQLWGEDPAIALSDLVEEIATEIRLLRLAETERALTKQPATPRWPTSIRPDWPPPCPAWAR